MRIWIWSIYKLIQKVVNILYNFWGYLQPFCWGVIPQIQVLNIREAGGWFFIPQAATVPHVGIVDVIINDAAPPTDSMASIVGGWHAIKGVIIGF